MGPGGGFRVILDTENWPASVNQAFHGVVVKVDSIHQNILGQGIRIDGKTVILRSDFYRTRFKIFNRMICSAMAEFEFESSSSYCLCEYLVS